eukprot:scaffold6315_cov100-Isochrysis_galbana.AAC.3
MSEDSGAGTRWHGRGPRRSRNKKKEFPLSTTHPLGRLGTPVLGSERAAARRRCTAPSTDRTEFRALSRPYGSPPVASACSGAPPAATADGAPTVRALVPATRRHVVHARRRIRNE